MEKNLIRKTSFHSEDRDVPSIIPLLKIGFNKVNVNSYSKKVRNLFLIKVSSNKTFPETTNLNRCLNELLTLEYGEVSNVRRLQAAHVLFTALEYTNDSIEIMNDQFKIVVRSNQQHNFYLITFKLILLTISFKSNKVCKQHI